jgi:hypothetical protein
MKGLATNPMRFLRYPQVVTLRRGRQCELRGAHRLAAPKAATVALLVDQFERPIATADFGEGRLLGRRLEVVRVVGELEPHARIIPPGGVGP